MGHLYVLNFHVII